MLSYIADALKAVEANTSVVDRSGAYAALRPLGISDFATILWHMPRADLPKVSSLLPAMASEDIQRQWTGFVWDQLLLQTVNFARSLADNYIAITGQSLRGRKILDYGCGYGRLLRVMRFYTDDLWGVDPWDASIELCQRYGLERVAQSGYLPTSLPVGHDFDLIFAFSVFTHTSKRATEMALSAMRKHVRANGVACITIRPVEYWRVVYGSAQSEAWLQEKEAAHERDGFVYAPHDLEAIEGEVHYGDSSMTLEWLHDVAERSGWNILATDRSADDPVQRYVFLQAKPTEGGAHWRRVFRAWQVPLEKTRRAVG